jgi:hypothetical protein
MNRSRAGAGVRITCGPRWARGLFPRSCRSTAARSGWEMSATNSPSLYWSARRRLVPRGLELDEERM